MNRRPGLLLLLVLTACGDEPASAAAIDASLPADDDFMGCPSSVPQLSLNLRATGASGRINAAVVDASRVPARRYLNDWTFAFTSAAGVPLTDVTVKQVRTFMPVHGHDGIVRPQVWGSGEPGRFEISSLNFNMRGPWEVQLTLGSASVGDDYLVLTVCIAE